MIKEKPSGTQIGNSINEGASFHGARPTPQRAGAAQAAVTQTSVALTGTLTGTVNGALVDVAATAGSCAGGLTPAASDVDTAIATAVASIVTGVNEQLKELQAQHAAVVIDIAAALVLTNEQRAMLVAKGLMKGAA